MNAAASRKASPCWRRLWHERRDATWTAGVSPARIPAVQVKAFSTLLKLARSDLETLRRSLADQFVRQRLSEERIASCGQSLRAEQQNALRDYESTRAYSGFAVWTAGAKRALEAELAGIAQEIERLRVLIAEAHVETRKFERLIELEQTRTRAALEKREDSELDELATMRAGRRSAGSGL